LFALIVGMFIIYNSFSIAVSHRRSEIGILRALGAPRGQIQKLFLLESIVAGVIGSTLGVFLGLFGAMAIAQYMSVLVEETGGVAQRVTELEMDPFLMTVGMVIGIVTSIFAAWIPARNAARVDPVKALQKGQYQVLSAGENRRRRLFALGCIVVAAVCLFFSESKFFFYAGYILTILAGVLLAPAFTALLSKGVRPVLKLILPAEGTLAADSLVQAPRRTSATVAALMLSLAMVVGFGGFTNSFYTSVDEWMETVVNPDFFISPSPNLTTRAITFPSTLGPLVHRVEGVDHVEVVRYARVPVREIPVLLIAMESDQVIRRIPLSGSLEEMNRLTTEGKGMIVSGSFALIQKQKIGDIVDLPTPTGRLSLPIVGIVRDYSDMQGSLFIDRSVYSKWWIDDMANLIRVYIKKGQDAGEVRQRILHALAGRERLLVLTNKEVRAFVMKVLDQWFTITYNQIAVALLVAVFGIVNTLTVSIMDRRRELGVMQAVGGLRNQIRRTVWLEAISISIIGLILGIALGAVNLYYNLGMVKRDIGGLDLAYIFPVSLVLFITPAIIAAAFIAALGPGESAVGRSLAETLEYE
jgi:putative ABC transport system permease protein